MKALSPNHWMARKFRTASSGKKKKNNTVLFSPGTNLIPLSHKYLLSDYYVPGTFKCMDTVLNKKTQGPALMLAPGDLPWVSSPGLGRLSWRTANVFQVQVLLYLTYHLNARHSQEQLH